MRKKTKYTNEPLGDVRVIDDFLPPPSELAFKNETVKITIGLSKSSVEFFKQEARKNNTQYQKMIRLLIDLYVLCSAPSGRVATIRLGRIPQARGHLARYRHDAGSEGRAARAPVT